jgi:hypothetical protein
MLLTIPIRCRAEFFIINICLYTRHEWNYEYVNTTRHGKPGLGNGPIFIKTVSKDFLSSFFYFYVMSFEFSARRCCFEEKCFVCEDLHRCLNLTFKNIVKSKHMISTLKYYGIRELSLLNFFTCTKRYDFEPILLGRGNKILYCCWISTYYSKLIFYHQ